MTASPEILAAFEAWKVAELAAHYAAPCPDEVMNALVERIGDAFDVLQALPPTSADDMLLKLFPFIIRDFEPSKGRPPLRPEQSRAYTYSDDFISRLIAQLAAASPAIGAAMAEPHPSSIRGAA